MADSNRVILATLSRYVKSIEHAYLFNTRLTTKIKETATVEYGSGGLDRTWTIKKSRNPNWESFGSFEKINVTAVDNTVNANLDYGQYRSHDFLPKKEQLQNKGGETQIFDLYRQKVDDLAMDAAQDFHTEIWSGSGTADRMVGLETALPDTNFTNKTYAGIAFTGNTFWQNYQVSGDGFAASNFRTDGLIAVEDAKLNCTFDPASGSPSWGITTRTAYEYLGRLHSTNERYAAETTRKMGGSGIVVHDMEILWDQSATSGLLRLMNSKYIELLFMTSSIFDTDTEETKSPPGTLFHLLCYPLLRIKQPRYFATIHGCD